MVTTSSLTAFKTASSKVPFWLWPNLLSLDAPVVAVVWQDIFARDIGTKLSISSRAALLLTVWLIYLTDRLLDTIKTDSHQQTARHDFYRSHRMFCYFLTALAASLLIASVIHLPMPVLMNGFVVAALVVTYFFIVHAVKGDFRRWLPKEASVGLLFSVGTTLAPFTGALDKRQLLFPALVFGLLCWTNSSAIQEWENGKLGVISGLLVRRLNVLALTTCLLCVAVSCFSGGRLSNAALSLTALGLWGVAAIHKELNPDKLRVGIDLPLLAPLLLIGLR